MDDELRGRLDGIEDAVERVEEVARELSGVLTQMRVGDAEARADVKVALGELRVASNALADAAQSLQKSELQAPERRLKGMDLWLVRIAAGAIVLAIIALGGKEFVAKLFGF